MSTMTVRLVDIAGLSTMRPVTGGVPIAQGSAPPGACFTLSGPNGEQVPLQTEVLSRWADGSARWVLLDYPGQAPANGAAEYTLRWGADLCPVAPEQPIVATQSEVRRTPSLRVGDVAVEAAEDRLLRVSDRLGLSLTLIDADGAQCETRIDSVEAETVGPLRATLCVTGVFLDAAGQHWMSFQLRASLYAGSTMLRLEPLIIADGPVGVLQRFRALDLTLTPTGQVGPVRVGGTPGGGAPAWEGQPPAEGVRLFQVDDQQYRIEGLDVAGGGHTHAWTQAGVPLHSAEVEGHAPGWVEFEDARGTVAVALREFWQQWPKSLEATPDRLCVGLFPRFEAGAFAHMEPWFKYQYLFDGDCYQLRTGQARRWELWINTAAAVCGAADGAGEALARHANAPLVPAPDPTQAIATGVWDEVVPSAPAGAGADGDRAAGVAAYDAWAANLFDGYVNAIEVQRDYGAMNWGDWYGERRINWGNHEYDTPNLVYIQFARTGDPRYYYLAEAAARHLAEVDTVHHVNSDLDAYFTEHFPHPTYPSRAGMMHEHAVGHVGAFYPVKTVEELLIAHGIGTPGHRVYTCLDPYNLGHVFSQGIVRAHYLTGDPFLRETADEMADNLAQLVEDREYKFMGHTHCGRITGWPLLALGAVYELERNPRYLAAMRTLADDALNDQDPVCGGWLIQPMAPDHCTCKTARHTGMAGFITAVLINGLSRYYILSGDERLPEAIEKAVTFLNNDTWREEWGDWRYTSCPASHAIRHIGTNMMALVNGVRITGNDEHLRILGVAWEHKFDRLRQAPPAGPGAGKTYSLDMYGSAETVGILAKQKS